MPDLCAPPLTAVNDSVELVAPGAVGLCLLRCTWLLLLRCWTVLLSSTRVALKNVLLDAVIGVVGVFAICLAGGGDKFLSDPFCS